MEGGAYIRGGLIMHFIWEYNFCQQVDGRINREFIKGGPYNRDFTVTNRA